MSPTLLKTLKLISFALIGGAVGYGLMVGALRILPDQIEYLKGGGVLGGISVFLLLIISYFFVTALHELGHLLTGLAQGFRFYMFVVGFLGVKSDENHRVKWYFNTDMQLFGGIAGSFPTTDDPNNLRKIAWAVAAGPLTTLVTGALFTWGAFAMLYHLTPDASFLYKFANGFLLFSAFLSLAIFMATTLPSRTGPFFTDRARFFRLIRGGKEAQVEQAVLQLITFSYSNRRYRDLDPATFDLIASDRSPVMHTLSDYYAYYYYLDRRVYDQALHYAQKMEQSSQGLPVSMKNEYLLEAAFSYAFIAKDAAQATDIWQKVQSFYEKQETVAALRTKIALHLVQQQPEAAAALLAKASALSTKPASTPAEWLEKDLLAELQAQLPQSTLVS